jgi:multiple sugar transport system substrate-binding protein
VRRLVAVLLVCLLGATALAQAPLRLAWWGGDARHAMYNELADRYEQQNPGVILDREFAGWGPYWERLATQIAGGNAPDIIHMHEAFLTEYASRGTLLDLTPYVEDGTLDLSAFPDGIVDAGRAGDAIVMVSLGNSSSGTHYNTRLFDEAGIPYPTFDWTWDDFERTAIAISEAHGPGVYGASDQGGWDATLELFMRQRGKTLFDGNALGFTRDDLIEYWSIWKRLREVGGVPPAEMTAERSSAAHQDSMLVHNVIAMQLMSGNQHRIFQQYTDDELGLTTLPRPNDPNAAPGDVISGAYISVSSRSRNPVEAVRFVNWLVNDPDVAVTYAGEHGPPGSVLMQAVIAESMAPADQRLMDMMQYIAPTAGLGEVRPQNAGEVLSAFTTVHEELMFGRHASVEAAVDAFFAEADFILD